MMKYLESLLLDARVESVDDERAGERGPNTDGIWVYLKPGFDSNDDPHAVMTIVHESSVKDLRRAMRRVTRVSASKLDRLLMQDHPYSADEVVAMRALAEQE